MDLYAHDELWPLFYTGRCRAVPMPALASGGQFLLPWVGPSVLAGGTRRERLIITRVVLTTVESLTVQDARDAGFLNNTELAAYLRLLDPGLGAAVPVFLAHFVRVVEGEKV